jgi:hypothetical protein
MKKLYLLLVACLITIAGFGQSGTTGPLTWSITDNFLTISGTGAMPDYSNSAPWSFYRSFITSVVISSGVTSIGNNAFSNYIGLTSITIPSSVKSIGNSVFFSCSGLTSMTIPSSITSIGDFAFYDCRELTSISIPNSVTSIGDYAFSDCRGLTSITIPNSVISIEEGAFSGCSGLKTITIPSSVTSIGNSVFSGCSGLTSFTIPNSVTSIGDAAFMDCSGLKSITIPSSVTSIESIAFSGCSGLTSIIIPSSVTSIGRYAFTYCSGLTSITVDETNISYSAEDGVLYDKNKKTLVCFPRGKTANSFSIPNTVTTIGEGAFSYGSGLNSVSIPNSVTSIGNNAFFNCIGLTSITIPSSVTSIGDYAFYNCRELTSISIPNSVTSIGDYAFSNCSGLTTVTIPNSVTIISASAFSDCKGLKDIYTERDTPALCDVNTFIGVNKTDCILHVPANSKQAYSKATGWKDFTLIDDGSGPGGTTGQLSVSSSQLDIGKEEGSTATSIVTSNTSWIASSNQDWLTVSPASGTGNATLTFTAKQNTTVDQRTATVILAATGTNPVSITITQQAGDALLSVSSPQLEIGKEEASTATSIVTSNTSWAATSNQDWLTVSPASGTGNGTLTFTAKQNTTVDQRTATVILAATGTNPVSITITQQAEDALLSVSSSQLEIGKEEASTATSAVTSNTSWTASSNEAWLTISPASGTGNGTLTFTAKQNTTVDQRTATVISAATGVNPVTITITQQAGDAFIITAQSLPLNGGTVTGFGEYARNAPVSLQAMSNDQYEFKGWKEDTTIISDAITYNFTATVARTLYAVFTPKENADTSMTITPQSSSASFVWSPINGASNYLLIIYSNTACTQELARYQIDADGKIINKSASTVETYASAILSCSIDELASGKTYYYSLTSYDSNSQALSVSSGNFTTLITGINEVDAVIPKVYPSPTTGMVYIEATNKKAPSIKVYNLQGRLLLQTQGNEVDLSDYANGMYILQIDGQTIKVEKK